MVKLGELLNEQAKNETAGRPKLKVCEKCGKEYFIYHPDNECQAISDKTNSKDKKGDKKNGKR